LATSGDLHMATDMGGGVAGPLLDFGAEYGFTVKTALFPELERG
jgi:hypothetical protein